MSSEFFVELANKVEGISEYNSLIGYYQRKEWARLDQGVQSFLTTFETSPLREAVAYLRVQSNWDRLTPEASEDEVIEAERLMREVLLLYPKSALAPVLSTTYGSYQLRSGRIDKSLAVFSEARERYPFSELSCVFQSGIAESHFHLGHVEQATRSFEQILQKCENPRLRVGAKLRTAEMIQEKDPKKAAKIFADVMDHNSQFVYQFFPDTLFNLGELRIRTGDLKSAKHFFSETIRHPDSLKSCSEVAYLRLGDIALKMKAPLQEVVGKYLEARENAPLSDIGRFAYVRALMLELDKMNPAERARRIKVTDEEANAISNREIQKEAYLEKGIALLQMGEELALPYLARYSEASKLSLKKENVGTYIRNRVGEQLASTRKRFDRALSPEEISDRLKPYEVAYSAWIEGESTAPKAKSDVRQWIVDQVERTPTDAARANAILTRYAASPFYAKGMWDSANAAKLQSTILGALLQKGTAENAKATAQSYRDNWGDLKKWLGSRAAPVEFIIAHQLQDQDTLMRTVRKGKTRGIASLEDTSVVLDPKWTPEYHLSVAQALLSTEQFKDAEKTIARISLKGQSPDFLDRYNATRVELYRRTSRYPTAFQLAWNRATLAPKDKKVLRLQESLAVANLGKLWGQSEPLLRSSKKAGAEGKDLAPFEYFAGRASFEAGSFVKAIGHYQAALAADPESVDGPEARYRLGKAYWIRRDKTKAIAAWRELSTLQDPFWSPLAQNELKLVAP